MLTALPTFRPAHAGFLLALLACQANAADLRVTKFTDSLDGACDADCSLREAVQHANMTAEPDRIILTSGTYSLSLAPARDGARILQEDENQNGDLDVMFSDLTIYTVGAGRIVIDGLRNDRLFDVHPGTQLNLRGVILQNGLTSSFGGALRNRGETNLRKVAMENSAAIAEIGAGGAIANFGRLNITSSRFSNNETYADAGSGEGGAIYNAAQGWLEVRTSVFEGNVSYDNVDTGRGAALYNEGLADIARSSFIGNKGGEYGNGSAILNAEGGLLKLTNSTLSGNRGYYGTGAFSNGQWGSRNNANTEALLINVTIADNTGGAALLHLGKLNARNSIVAGTYLIPDEGPNRPANCRNGEGASFQARGLMLGKDNQGCAADLPIDDSLTFTQILEPLADPSLATPLYPLLENSPAIDAAIGNCPQTDQRRVARPQDGNGDGVAVCDLGAYELKPF